MPALLAVVMLGPVRLTAATIFPFAMPTERGAAKITPGPELGAGSPSLRTFATIPDSHLQTPSLLLEVTGETISSGTVKTVRPALSTLGKRLIPTSLNQVLAIPGTGSRSATTHVKDPA